MKSAFNSIISFSQASYAWPLMKPTVFRNGGTTSETLTENLGMSKFNYLMYVRNNFSARFL